MLLQSIKRISTVALFTLTILLSNISMVYAAPNGIDQSMYFLADIRDAEYCQPVFSKGKLISFGKNVTNPAMTCPDAFSWSLFAKSVKDRFWSRWANETQNWPEKPWPLCSSSRTTDCCNPNGKSDKEHCPYFPGNSLKSELYRLDDANNRLALKIFKEAPALIQRGRAGVSHNGRQVLAAQELDQESFPECKSEQIDGLIPAKYESIGRIVRQTNNELTVRNKPFHDYLYRNNLYNSNGVLDVFNRNTENQQKNAPYHLKNKTYSKRKPGQLARIDLPPEAIMIKSNWLFDGLAKRLGIKSKDNKGRNIFIQKYMETIVCAAQYKDGVSCDQKEHPENFCKLSGPHYLMAFHVSSKDIPQWVWTTFEHVNNPGRCDFTGCNDSFGFSAEQKDFGEPTNYVAPMQQSDQLSSPSDVFLRDQFYPEEKMSRSLHKMFDAYGIGKNKGISTSDHEPDAEDWAWTKYRLKGSQVNFTDHEGRSTLLGNSVTEAGFMAQSSCISCHSRAGVHKKSDGSANFFQLGVFDRQLSDFGYQQSVHNMPNPAWFHKNDNNATLDVLQTDFIWGFLFAKPLVN